MTRRRHLIDLVDQEWLKDVLPHEDIPVPELELPVPENENIHPLLQESQLEHDSKWTDLRLNRFTDAAQNNGSS